MIWTSTTASTSAPARGGSTPSGVQPPLRAPGRETTDMVNMSLPSLARKSQQGISLIEVMVSVLILAIWVLGVAALQTVALKNSGGSASRTQAAIQIYSMMDIIRANRANLGIYNTNIYTEGDGTGADGTMMGWLDGLQATVDRKSTRLNSSH